MLENFKKYGMILLGSAISGLALDLFLVPAQIAPGGMSGLATVVHYFTNISVNFCIKAIIVCIAPGILPPFASIGITVNSVVGLSQFT